MPDDWDAVLAAPALVLNLPDDGVRRAECVARLREAGFRDVRVLPGIDARRPESAADVRAAWRGHGIDPDRRGAGGFDPSDAAFVDQPGKQGCMLAQLAAWRYVIDEGLPHATIWEDDVLFHRQWAELAPQYWAATPKDGTDVVYFGSHCAGGTPYQVVPQPVFCLQAYLVSGPGIRRLYEWVLGHPSGVRTIDCMLWDRMCEEARRGAAGRKFVWYAWNAQMFPDPAAEARKHPEALQKDVGLVFQDYRFHPDLTGGSGP